MRRRPAGVWSNASAGLLVALSTLLPGVAWASGETFVLAPDTQLVGETTTVAASHEDTLTDIARVHGLGYEEIVWANPTVDIWLPGDGTQVTLPLRFVLPGAAREGIVVNIAEYRLYYYYKRDGQLMLSTFPISIGRMDWATPIGRWAVTAKQKDPAWYPPESIRAEHLEDGRGFLAKMVPAGPDNPLGQYALRLSVNGYLIHGTNKPVGVGMQVTHGCIRMYPEDIEWIFPQVPVKTPVTIMNQPYKFGWSGNDLYLEVHPPLEDDHATRDREMTALTEQYVLVTRERPARIDWQAVEEAYRRRDGIPALVGSSLAAEVPGLASGNLAAKLPDCQPGTSDGQKKNPASGGVIRVFVVVANPVSARASVCGDFLLLLFLPLLLLFLVSFSSCGLLLAPMSGCRCRALLARGTETFLVQDIPQQVLCQGRKTPGLSVAWLETLA